MDQEWTVLLLVGVPTLVGGYYFFRTLSWTGSAKNAKSARKQAKDTSEWVGFKVVKFLFTKRK
jgi:hypothetical protein